MCILVPILKMQFLYKMFKKQQHYLTYSDYTMQVKSYKL